VDARDKRGHDAGEFVGRNGTTRVRRRTPPLTPVQLGTYEALRGKKPNHRRMHAWSFAVLARKLSLQALRQKRRP
jgi:hypothetical protein